MVPPTRQAVAPNKATTFRLLLLLPAFGDDEVPDDAVVRLTVALSARTSVEDPETLASAFLEDQGAPGPAHWMTAGHGFPVNDGEYSFRNPPTASRCQPIGCPGWPPRSHRDRRTPATARGPLPRISNDDGVCWSNTSPRWNWATSAVHSDDRTDDRCELTLHQALVRVIAQTHQHVGHAGIVRELIDGPAGLRTGPTTTRTPVLADRRWD
ncbi:DUF664 domain-containing protein [Streptomyces smyrnaeus]|uniref:mycothiol transferase n=1 Tax=Streptomyces smyrnaeus TaxID=1387713 RepID=UPI003F4CE450